MTPKQQSILERYGIQNPPEWSGMTGQGADTMYSIGGKWMKAGQTHPSGYTVGQYDPKNKALGMSIHGVNIPVGMKSGTVKDFETPANPYNKTLFGAGAGAYAYDPVSDLNVDIPLSDEYLKLDQKTLSKKFKELDVLRGKVSGMSGTMSDADMYTFNEYIKLRDESRRPTSQVSDQKIYE
jgi:hypothetical protein